MLLKKIAQFTLFSSIYIAACAVALSIETNILLHLPLNNISFYCFVFGATLVQYNLHYIVKKTAVEGSERLEWSLHNKALHTAMFLTGCILIIISLFSFRLQHFYVLSILGVIAFLYSYPALPFGKKRRIKEYGLLKILTLALLWTLVTVWFPVSNMVVDKTLYLVIFCERFVFMFVLCLLFDIRDIEIDRKETIRTLPVILGRYTSYKLAILALFLFLLIVFSHFLYSGETAVLAALALSAITTLVAIDYSRRNNSDFLYLAGIDGMMLIQAGLIYLVTVKL
ncbi:MAG: UbiA family prenyltransferase [Ginsengibacter sp.]